MSRLAAACLVACTFLPLPALAQDGDTVTLTVTDVKSGQGQIIATLCDDPKTFLTTCATYRAAVPALVGSTVLAFHGVKPGSYALRLFHDANSDGKLQIAQEGWAYGNDMTYPPSFEGSSIKVAGDTEAHVHLVSLFAPSTAAAPVATFGAPSPDGVVKTDLRQDGLYGELYMPAHARALPLIIAIGGSEGGLDTMSSFAVGFTKHGYAVLALAYWKEPGLPQSLENVPLEYFDRAIAWAKIQPGIDAAHIGIIGWSRGAEAALLVASRNPALHAVTAVAPSAYVWKGLNFNNPGSSQPAWTVAGTALPNLTPANVMPGQPMAAMFQTALANADAHPETIIPVEKINGAVLLLSGSDDRLWPSNDFSNRIMARLEAQHFAFPHAHQNYDGAGHGIFVGDPALFKGDMSVMDSFMGGANAANVAARADIWSRSLAFFDAALKR